MSLTTRCPACRTLFKVVPDQLRVSEGWVRCGQCSEIFDASLHLQQTPRAVDPVPDNPPSSMAIVAAMAVVASPPVQVDIEHPDKTSVQMRKAAPPAMALPGQFAVVPDNDQDPHEAKPESEPESEPKSEPESEPKSEPDAESGAIPQPSVSFMRARPNHSFWRKTWVRVALVLTSLCLLMVLALQVVVHQRDRIAAMVSDARPALAAVCSVVGCRVSALRQIDSIVIDSSTFSKLRGDAYRLSLTIKNNAAIELAMPALELTLTDSQDQPAMRRVFLPAEFGATSNVLAAGTEWAGAVVLNVRPGGSADQIAGYRILVFYP